MLKSPDTGDGEFVRGLSSEREKGMEVLQKKTEFGLESGDDDGGW